MKALLQYLYSYDLTVDSRDSHAKALFKIRQFMGHTYVLSAKTITL